MTLLSFLRFYVLSALFGAGGLLWVGVVAEREGDFLHSSSAMASAERLSLKTLLIEPSGLTTQRALVKRHTRAPRLVGLVNAGRDVGAFVRPSHPSVTAGETALRQMATDAAGLTGVRAVLLHRLVRRESEWLQSARGKHGEIGLTQIKPATAREVSPTLDIYTEWGNLLAGSAYLSRMLTLCRGDERCALMAYQGGAWRKFTKPETVAYAADILKGMN